MSKNLVVFDLEMNQGYKPYTFDYKGIEQTLRGEIIQIGAAKVDESFRVLDTFTITMRPQIFRKLHHHVARVTGLSQQVINSGVPVKQGISDFINWCGEDAVLLEWGMDDVPVFKQNLVTLGMDESFPTKWYDLQQMVVDQFPPAEGEKMNLEAVVERMDIPMERPFHDALSDVLYTCDVIQKLDPAAAFENYPSEADTLYQSLARKGEIHDFELFSGYVDVNDWHGKELYRGKCPHCGEELKPDDYWTKLASNSYYTLAACPSCKKESFLLFKLSRYDGLHWNIARATRMTDDESLAKWHKDKKAALARRSRNKEEKTEK